MANKDDRKIVHAIRMPATEKTERKTYGDGDEDALMEVATPEQLKRWVENGDITGTWGKVKAEPAKEAKK